MKIFVEKPRASLRRYPYPYQAILALSSDLDDTPSAAHYLELIRFLNTDSQTIFGTGVALEFAQSIFFAESSSSFSYWKADNRTRAIIRTLIDSGHIDTLHSYGSKACSRDDAQLSLLELRKASRRLSVWVDHAVAPSNFGRYQMRGFGDNPISSAYHADLSTDYGIDYCWMGQVTTVIGQNAPITASALFNDGMTSIGSLIRSAKEVCKVAIPTLISQRYSMHRANSVLLPVKLRDGRHAFEFLRCNPSPHGITHGDSADCLAENICQDNLNTLVAREGVMILYTHLGRRFPAMDTRGYRALRDALEFARELVLRGALLMMSTARALDYLALSAAVDIEMIRSEKDDRFVVRIDRANRALNRAWNRSGGEGITIYCDAVRPYVLELPDGTLIRPPRNPPDETGKYSVSIPLRPLEAPYF